MGKQNDWFCQLSIFQYLVLHFKKETLHLDNITSSALVNVLTCHIGNLIVDANVRLIRMFRQMLIYHCMVSLTLISETKTLGTIEMSS